MRPAAFLDRDGTLIEEGQYISRPEQVRLLAGAAAAVRMLRGAGLACVIVSNQSGVGRGLFTMEDLERVHDEVVRRLREEGAEVDGAYYCPAAPAAPGEEEHAERKPAPGMLVRAAREMGLDLAASWVIGDSVRDLEAGRRAGCRGGALVRTGHALGAVELRTNETIVDDVLAAATWIIQDEAT
jgi:D-glycero-D-manno-heptose 1,7-bisphosphate phosphatase